MACGDHSCRPRSALATGRVHPLTLIALFLGEETKDVSLDDGESATADDGIRAKAAASAVTP
ncbi:hypothetical protein [Streptomyces sp. NPDC058145]|uniref:hypothetical protein n=1 Tax=Streptomyces sp. NPDC058145 TaxID=3346356 RepID=UPI0036E37090